ncbi:hypothetical protein CEJ83_20550, partial [Acinetobacter baumannii]
AGGVPLLLRISQALTNRLKLRIDRGLERGVIADIRSEESAMVTEVRETQPRELPPELVGCLVVGQSSLLCSVKGSKPEAGAVLWETDLR